MGKWVVVADAGHFGYESGAVGPAGTYESTITKAVADRFVELCRAAPELEIFLTQSSGQSSVNGDLQVRCDQANAWYNQDKKNLFISFHCNSFTSPDPTYISTWIQTMGGEAEMFARLVQTRLCDALDFEKYGLEDAGVRTANYKVLRSTRAPAVLIEMGFISHPQEEQALSRPDTQDKIARTVFAALLNYTGIQAPAESAPAGPAVEFLGEDGSRTAVNFTMVGDTMYIAARQIVNLFGGVIDWTPARTTIRKK